jgi:hypothetical protein
VTEIEVRTPGNFEVEHYEARARVRLAALDAALRLAEIPGEGIKDMEALLADAGKAYAWLARLRLELVIKSVTEQGMTAQVPVIYTPGGALQLTDTQQFTATVQAEDAKGFAVADQLTWSADDGGAVVTLAVSADTLSCLFVAVAPGTANYTVTDGTLSATGQAVVTAGAAAQLSVTEGAPEAQPAPAPPAA